MPSVKDGPANRRFKAMGLKGGRKLSTIGRAGASKAMADAARKHAPTGNCVSWGMLFKVGGVAVAVEGRKPVTVDFKAVKAKWLVLMHTSDYDPPDADRRGFIKASRGRGRLGEHAADYIFIYADGTEERVPIRRRHEITAFTRGWGENCFKCVAHKKPFMAGAVGTNPWPGWWGRLQTKAVCDDGGPFVNWLWAWENPRPRKAVKAVRIEPVSGTVMLSAVTAGNASELPTRWLTRRKAILTLPKGVEFDADTDEKGRHSQIAIDMGRVISVIRRPVYPNGSWAKTYNNKLPTVSDRELLVEYAAHPEAEFHLPGGRTVPVAKLAGRKPSGPIKPVKPATQRVTIRAVEKGSRKPVAVKLHVHGESNEYLAPVDRHRIPNPNWFEDYSVDFSHMWLHHCTYVDGETTMDLPLGTVYIEVSKGFEIRPVRKTVKVTRNTKKITVEISKVLPWRERGWVSADTHVHFLSPNSALLEGAGEGVNVVNVLASQWGELMTNVGDFDGRTTHGSNEAGGDGEYMVRVGTENRQHIMGHISLLGYDGGIIAPMTTGGADESAIGDPVEVLLTEWAKQCRKQNGVVIIPHFPNPRLETAATIVSGSADGVEMTAWGNLYNGIDPYSLSDWYRYLNCGYMTAAVGGTDKMSAATAVGTIRTYAQVPTSRRFTFDAWKDAVRAGRTFVTYGPLMEFSVDGKAPGSRIGMSAGGGTVDIEWKVASVTVPTSKVELIVNGEVVDGKCVKPGGGKGHFKAKLDKSSWVALLVRGRYRDKPEMIAAHSSPVMIEVKGSQFLAAADALTILEQIEGAMAYLETGATRADEAARKRMKMVLTAAHREIHNRMHRAGFYHNHTATEDHKEHH